MFAFTPQCTLLPLPRHKGWDGLRRLPLPPGPTDAIFSGRLLGPPALGPAFLSLQCSSALNSHSSVCTLAPIHWTLKYPEGRERLRPLAFCWVLGTLS